MKYTLILGFLLINSIYSKLETKSNYDYSSYKANKINVNVKNENISCINSDESAVYIDTKNSLSVKDSNIKKDSGDSSNIQNSDYYGVNAAILVQGGYLEVHEVEILTKTKGANALVATNDAYIDIGVLTIISEGQMSARGLLATYNGTMDGNLLNINTTGESCPSISIGRGGGLIKCKNCILSTKGKLSPLSYSSGYILFSKSKGVAEASQAFIIDGKSTIEIERRSVFKCSATPDKEEIDQCGIMIYQSMSGDSSIGTGTFKSDDSTIEILNSSKYFNTAPMFLVTNTKALIELSESTFIYGSNIFLSVKGTNKWGEQGKNGGDVYLTLKNQNIEGDLVLDEISSLTIDLQSSSIKGTINSGKKAMKLAISLDSQSKIYLTGDSCYTELKNSDLTGSNLINGTYTWTKYEERQPENQGSEANIISNSKLIYLILGMILI